MFHSFEEEAERERASNALKAMREDLRDKLNIIRDAAEDGDNDPSWYGKMAYDCLQIIDEALK